jgi:hypothetical protein
MPAPRAPVFVPSAASRSWRVARAAAPSCRPPRSSAPRAATRPAQRPPGNATRAPTRRDLAGAEAGIADAADRAKALEARDLLPCIEAARAELARSRGDTAGCERALRDAARLHRENGDAWLATQVEARLAV